MSCSFSRSDAVTGKLNEFALYMKCVTVLICTLFSWVWASQSESTVHTVFLGDHLVLCFPNNIWI